MRVLIGLLIALFGAVPQSAVPDEADEILAQLSKIRLDKKQIHNIRDVTIRRDVLSISLTRGAVAFLEPVKGKVTGAIFIGSGEIVAIPPDSIEKQQVHKFTGSPILNESFQSAMFRFTDDTFEELTKEIAQIAREEVSEEDTARFAAWDEIISQRSGSMSFRILTDLLESSKRPLFYAALDGDKTGRFEVVFDSQLAEEVTVFKVPDVWASFNQRSQARNPEAVAHENKSPFDVLSYDIEAKTTPAYQMDAKAAVRLKATIDGLRVLTFELMRDLQISSISLDAGETVRFHRHPAGNATAIVLPRPLRSGEEITLRFAYAGNVSARRLWYPNVPWADRAVFNLSLDNTTTRLTDASSIGFVLGNAAVLPDENGPAAMRAYFSEMVGPYPYPDLKIVQSALNETRNWPGLIELPNNNDLTVAQEIARQWFGHQVIPASYRDQWLLDALSRYVAAMYTKRLPEILEEMRSVAIESDAGGALALGPRLVSTVTPNGYRVVPSKGIWVVHMLRSLTKQDSSFIAMLKEVIDAYGGKSISTWDFKRVAEKHVGMELDWFFDQWVFGMGIPAYSLDYKVEQVKNAFAITGTVKQSNVPDGFTMPVPLYADDVLLGRVSVGDAEGEFRFTVAKKPERVAIDPNRNVLSK